MHVARRLLNVLLQQYSTVAVFRSVNYAGDTHARNLYKFLEQEICTKFLMQVSCTCVTDIRQTAVAFYSLDYVAERRWDDFNIAGRTFYQSRPQT